MAQLTENIKEAQSHNLLQIQHLPYQVPFVGIPSIQSQHSLTLSRLPSLDPRLSYGFSAFASQDGSLALISSHMSKSPVHLRPQCLETPHSTTQAPGHTESPPLQHADKQLRVLKLLTQQVQNSHFSSLSDGRHEGNYSTSSGHRLPPAPRGGSELQKPEALEGCVPG